MLGRKRPQLKLESPDESFPPPLVRAGAALRLTISFMLVVVIAFLSVEGWRTWRDYRSAFASARDSVTNLARATAQHAEDTIRQVDVLTAVLSERVEGDGLQNIDIPRIHKLLQQQAAIMPQLHGLFIYGPDGEWIVTDKQATPESANNADRDYFQYHRTHEDRNVRIGEVIRSRSTHDLIIPISRRLNNPDGSFAGVLLGTVKVSYFVDYYGDFKIDDKGALVLAMRNGSILVRRPFLASVVGKSLVNSVIFRNHLPNSNQGVAEARAVVDDTERLYGYRALTTYPLVVEAGLSRESIIAPWRRDLLKTGFVLVFLIVILMGFGLIVLSHLRYRMTMETRIRSAHQTMRDMALTDSLTGLGNRRRLDSALADEIRRAWRQDTFLALIMLDVDYFKRFNDKYGHAAGDDCLRAIAGAIQQTIKRPGDLAVRYGGEEFTILLPDTHSAGAAKIAQEILESIRALNIEHGDHPLGLVTASAGITTCRPSSEDVSPAMLIKAADAFLYLAKNTGRNRWCSAEASAG
ncbi:sensor domain-containing diguanylate cyclase [Pseudomonas fluorescens]|uniref:diguanylate cyclase n=1 Tax=Pseudomonas fluorescens TaxID=294 RepID=A0A944DJF9_PSEFL|nr:sensor domain-containing diguanylate cyclase [Pseudomonas fluorescens]MBT2295861.1 GGDEF domain-containing protein [Pseudomonas fluorescens]MBT2306118.1 GGDEF domain-containing protein [Pseudomonas fluorescens]MBT2314525.1 GGDEF domain-containing protein [Pseudomonas fluorescens]MBT2315726.1 GGDEF domain-containing protein [Pseudomonas fluorescens]MBT2330331.1 GGDEF domain-containing protein [Pseudomonas fluorescens]